MSRNNKRKGNRHFNARQLGQKAELKTTMFLGQQFIVANEYGGKNKRFDLVGMAGTDLDGKLFKGITHEALRRFRDDRSNATYILALDNKLNDVV